MATRSVINGRLGNTQQHDVTILAWNVCGITEMAWSSQCRLVLRKHVGMWGHSRIRPQVKLL